MNETGNHDTPAVPPPADAVPDEASVPAYGTDAASEDHADARTDPRPFANYEIRRALSMVSKAAAAVLDAADTGNEAAAVARMHLLHIAAVAARRAVDDATGYDNQSKGVRARPDLVRARVLAHLRAYPGQAFGIYDLGAAIGDSGYAIADALDDLTESGRAVQVAESPHRFTTTPGHT